MYEDAKNYSVPISWLAAWLLTYVGFWLILGPYSLYWVDTLLMAGVLGLSLIVVRARRPENDRSIASLFGSADIIVLGVFTLLLGFERTTGVLLLTLLLSGVYLLWQRRLKIGQRIPLLTMMLLWGIVALFV